MSNLNPSPSVSQVDQSRGWKPLRESQLDILREGRFSDVTFIVGPSKERIPCLHIFLQSRSPVFQVMFSERWNQDQEIPLEDVDPKIFTKFLKFMYADDFDATVPEALGLLEVAHKYDVHLLVDKCEKLLESETTINDAVDVFQAARKYGKIQLMEKIGDLISKSPSKLRRFPSFSRLNKETLTFIVKRNDLEKIKEVDLFRLALQWAQNQSGLTAQESLEDILPHIRFPVMTLEEFTKNVLPTGLLSQSKVIELFTYFGSDADTKKSLAGTLEFSTQRRQSPDSIVSVPIYSGNYDGKDANVRMHEYDRLRESLQFYSRANSVQPLRKSSYLGCDDRNHTSVGLNGVSIHCPVTSCRSWSLNRIRNFEIQLLAKVCCDGNYNLSLDENYTELLAVSCVQLEEGKVTDIKFATVIPVRHRTLYCIIVEETTDYPGIMCTMDNRCVDASKIFYEENFGRIYGSVDVNVDKKCQAVLAIHRNKMTGFGQTGYKHPRFICKLGFEEL